MNLVPRNLPLILTLCLGALLAYKQQALSQSTEIERLKGDRGGEVILASIQAMAGWKTWKTKTDVQYERDVTRYEEDGRVIR